MRLVRIEAERFGGIDDRTLGDLSPDLTVVVGPNEAGKSSLTALVRHVLYGFPTPASKENPYLSASGAKRRGRLIFADDSGEWVVERSEGAHGGPVVVRALAGRSREGLVDELTRGVSGSAYRVVFGFGLAEMQEIETLKGKGDDLMSRLYAAGAGLTVSPPDIRARLVERMESLWKKGGSAPVVNRARARREEVRKAIRQLEGEADGFRADAAELAEVEARLAEARASREQAQGRWERMERAVREVERLMETSGKDAARARDLQREAEEARRDADAIPVAAEALAAADSVRGLVSESPAIRERIAALGDQRRRLEAIEQRLHVALDESGWSEERALAAAADAGIALEIESARTALADLRARADLASEARDRAEALAGGAGAAPGGEPVRTRPWLLPGIVAAALGAAGLIVGAVLRQPSLAVFGALVAIAGAVLGLVRAPGRVAGTDAAKARADLAAAEVAEVAARRALDERAAAWAERVRSWGLGAGSEEPAAVAARLQAAREVRAADRDRTPAREAIAREQQRIDAFVERVALAAASVLGTDPAAADADGYAELLARASARVDAALEAERTRGGLLMKSERLTRETAEAVDAAEVSAAAAAAELASVGIDGGDLEDVRRAESAARLERDDAMASFESLTAQAASLRTRIDAERREDRLAQLRLEDETIGERIAADAREYVVLALAARLLASAQERYERERQPEVVKRAEAEFARMTNGRYPRITIPLGKDAIEVFTASALAAEPGKLSRGTAEQLYLALRLGLVDQLGEVGAGLPVLMDDVLVNFSPDRLAPAVTAIAELALRRQVVFFTCHPAMADLLCKAAPTAVRIELEGPLSPR